MNEVMQVFCYTVADIYKAHGREPVKGWVTEVVATSSTINEANAEKVIECFNVPIPEGYSPLGLKHLAEKLTVREILEEIARDEASEA